MTQLTLPRRAKVKRNDLFIQRRWVLNASYAICEFVRLLEGRRKVYYAEKSFICPSGRTGWDILSRHRSKAAALRAVHRAALKRKPR